MESDREDSSNVFLMAGSGTKDTDNDLNDSSLTGNQTMEERESVSGEEIPELTREQMSTRFRESFETKIDLDDVQELMANESAKEYDKAVALLRVGLNNHPMIVSMMFHNPDLLSFLINVYESVKPTIEKMQPREAQSESLPPLISWPFLIHPQHKGGGNLLHYLTGDRSVEIIKLLSRCSIFDQLINMPDTDGSTPLINALKSGDIKLASEMADLGSHVDSFNNNKESPIFLAVKAGDVELVKKMLQEGCRETQEDILKSDKIYGQEHSIFYPAILSGNSDMVKYLGTLFEHESELELLVKEFKNCDISPLAKAIAQYNMTEMLKFLLALDDSEVLVKGIAELLVSAIELANKDIITTILNVESCWQYLKSRNILHHAAKFTEITKLLLEEMEKVFDKPSDVYDVIHQVDEVGCTAIHYAAVAGNSESLKVLAQCSVRCNKDSDRTAYDYILSCVECKGMSCLRRISVETIKNAIESLKSDDQTSIRFNRRLCLTGAAQEGKADLIRYLIDINVPIHTSGYLIQRNPLQAAVYQGSLPTVKLIAERCPEFLDAKCMKHESPLEIAVKNGEKDILEYLISSGVKPVDKCAGVNLLSFSHECSEEICITLVDAIIKQSPENCNNLTEALESAGNGVILDWIQHAPKLALHVLDIYGDESNTDFDFYPLKGGKDGDYVKVIKEMIKCGKEEYFSHRLVRAFLNTQLNAKTRIWGFLNSLMYISFLALFSAYVGLYSQGASLKSPRMIALTVLILLFCSGHMVKEILQMTNNFKQYIKSINNFLEWTIYICTFIFLLPMRENKNKSQIEAGAIAIFLAWINQLWFLRMNEGIGVHILLTKKVFSSLLKVLPVVIYFVIAFTMTFLLLKHEDSAFSTFPWSFLTIFLMMGGEIGYRDAFLSSESSVYILQYFFLILYFLIMCVVVMNVFVGLAVGDTEQMLKRSAVEKERLKAINWIDFRKSMCLLPQRWRPQVIDRGQLPEGKSIYEIYDLEELDQMKPIENQIKMNGLKLKDLENVIKVQNKETYEKLSAKFDKMSSLFESVLKKIENKEKSE